MRVRKRLYTFIALAIVLFSCLNVYEKSLVGDYIVKDYEFRTVGAISPIPLPKLVLK